MSHKLKALGLAMVAVLAMSAVVASAASAAAGIFTSEKSPVTLTRSQEGTNEWSIGTGARKVSCATASAQGTASNGATSLTLTPTYTGCTSTGGLGMTVTVNGCDFVLHPTTGTATSGTETMDVVCPVGKEITFDVYGNGEHIPANIKCEYHIKAQTGVAAGTYKDIGAGTTQEITETLNVTGVHTVNTVGSKLLCGLAAGETGTSTLAGAQVLTGENAAGTEHIGISIS